MAMYAPITGAPTRASAIHRRGFLGSLAVLPAIAAAPALATAPQLTPFRIAEARYWATVNRFNSLPDHLEHSDPAAFKKAEHDLSDAFQAVIRTPTENGQEFAAAFLIACDDGDAEPHYSALPRLLADAKRLTGAS